MFFFIIAFGNQLTIVIVSAIFIKFSCKTIEFELKTNQNKIKVQYSIIINEVYLSNYIPIHKIEICN